MFLVNDASSDKQIALFLCYLKKSERFIISASPDIELFVKSVPVFVVFYYAMRIGGFLSLYFFITL